MQLSGLSQEIFQQRYAIPGEDDWDQCAKRVANSISSIELNGLAKEWGDKFYAAIAAGNLMPGGRVLFGAGRRQFNMLNCYRLHAEDTVESIGKLIHDTYLVSCGGGGIGFNFSDIRPKGDDIQNIRWSAPGAVSNMKMINEVGEHVRSGKNRRTALIAILNIDHPDLLEFLHVKLDLAQLQNFNISVGITDDFIKAVRKNKPWVFKFNGRTYKTYEIRRTSQLNGESTTEKIQVIALDADDAVGRAQQHYRITQNDKFDRVKEVEVLARDIWETIIKNAWACGEPGIYNLDLANSHTNVSYFESLDSTNPCYAKGSLVSTPSGPRLIEEISECDPINTVLGTGLVQTAERHDSVPVFKVTLSDGSVHRVTATHQFHAYQEENNHAFYREIAVEDLKLGDVVRIQPACITNATQYFTYNELSRKTLLSQRDLGFMIGVLLGDGCYSPGTLKNNVVKIATNASEHTWNTLLRQAIENVIENDNVSYEQSKDVRGRLTQSASWYTSNKNGLANFVHESLLMPCKSIDKFIPLEYQSGDDQFRGGILDGLISTDGNVNLKSSQPMLRFKTASIQLAQDFRLMCLGFGIHARIYEAKRKEHEIDGRRIKCDNPVYEVCITGEGIFEFVDRVGVSHPDKRAKLMKIRKFGALSPNTWRASIVSIESDGEDEVFDLYEPVSDTWIVNGAVSRGCGEIPLPQYGNCCLGHVNLANMYDEKKHDVHWKKFADTIRLGVRFLDDVLAANHYPISECKTVGERSRRIGLGVTGLHYLLLRLGHRYGDEKCLEFLDRLFATFRDEAYKASINLAKEKGAFPAFDADQYAREEFFKHLPPRIQTAIKKHGIRNAVLLTIAPTGTSSMVLGVSSGIEPIFSPVYRRHFREGNIWREEYVADALFTEYYLAGHEDLSHFCGAFDISVEQHIQVQATIQKYIDSAISKTTNIPKSYKWQELSEIILEFAPYVKGFTIYRAGSRGNEPLEVIDISTKTKLQQAMEQAGVGVASLEACRSGVCEM